MSDAAPQCSPGLGRQAAAAGGSEQGAGEATMHTAVGQLTYRRAVSKKLVFYDLLCSGPVQQECTWMEVVVKLGTYSSRIEDLADLRSGLKLGDIVRVQGWFSGSNEVQATAVSVVEAWRDSHPGQTFRPRPSPLHSSGAQQGQEQQQQPRQQERQQQQDGLQPPAANRAWQHFSPQADSAVAAALAAAAGASPDPSTVAVAAATSGAAATAAAPLCKAFVNTGSCAKGDACRFAHVHTGVLRQQWVADRRSDRRLLSSWHGFAHSAGAAAKRRRAQVLAAWLVQTYGRELLNSGEGVLDVAGGAGGVTFELRQVHGIRCTLVDPRPLKLNKSQLRQLQAAGRGASICTVGAAQLQQEQDGSAAATPPAAALLAPTTSQATAGQDSADADAAGADPLAFFQVQELFGPELWRSAGWRSRFSRGFSLVLACHPDQATEPALEYALEEGLPFAIVPCCVFPRLFAHRRLERSGGTLGGSSGGSSDSGSSKAGGGEVLTYSDLVDYIAERGQAQRAVLGFEGANTVLYRGAPAAATVAAAAAAAAAAAGAAAAPPPPPPPPPHAAETAAEASADLAAVAAAAGSE